MIIRVVKQVRTFLEKLPKGQRAEVYAILEDLQKHGLKMPLVSLRQIKGRLWEIRISQNRIFYVIIETETMVLLHAYKKQTQKAPQHEIETALKRMRKIMEET